MFANLKKQEELDYSEESQEGSPEGWRSQSSEGKIERHHRPILISDVEQLYAARERLRGFAEEIGSLKYSGVRRDVIQHCDKVKISLNHHLTFEKVEKMVKNRIEKMIKNKRIKKNWSEEDVLILIWIVSKYADSKFIDYIERDLNSNDWNFIAYLIPGVQGESCMFKWLSLKKNNLSDNNWSDKESILLDRIVKKYGEDDWGLVSQKLYYSNNSTHKIYRCPKQCREHWNCYLNPKLKKGPWSRQEDILLLTSVLKNNGLKRWAEMVKMFNGRTQNALKNRFTLIIEKEEKSHANGKNMTELELIEEYLDRIYVEQFVSIKNQHEAEPPKQPKTRSTKRQTIQYEPKSLNRTSLRRRHSTKTTIAHEPLDRMEQFKPNLKMEEEPSYHQIYYPPSHLMEKEDQFSQPCFHVNLNPQIFEQEDEEDRTGQLCKDDLQLPGIQEVKVVKMTMDNLMAMMNTGGAHGYVPCTIMGTKLTKFNF